MFGSEVPGLGNKACSWLAAEAANCSEDGVDCVDGGGESNSDLLC